MAATSPFPFPPALERPHVEQCEARGITMGFALASGVRTIADNEARKLGFEASVQVEERKHGLQGICFTYCELETRAEISWRLKPDTKFVAGEKPRKYLSRLGDKVRPYFPHTTSAEMREDTKVNVILTEGEFKTLSLAENIVPIASRATCVIGLQGVNGGWHRDSVTINLPDGSKEKKKEGAPHLVDGLEDWEWKKRTVYIVFDSDVGTKLHAAEFKRSRRSGAWGAEYTLAQLLKAKGAEVRIVVLPGRVDGTKYGADDLIKERGAHEALKLIYNNWVVERDPDEVLYSEKRTAITFISAAELVRTAPPRPPMVIDGILPEGCVAMLAGPPGVGKSYLAMNACNAVASGGRFLDFLRTVQGGAIYIQCELPAWMLGERIRNLGPVSPGLTICTPGSKLPLNWWEPDGFNKKRETGSRALAMILLDQIRSYSPKLVCFDSLKDFTSISMLDPEAASHLCGIFRMIAVHARCGVLLVHHHRKTGGREQKYEGQDDMVGSFQLAAEVDSIMSIYQHKRADETSRFKLMFSKLRHSAPLEPLEIERLSGNNSLLWTARPWQDHTGDVSDDQRLLDALGQGSGGWQEVSKRAGMSKSAFFRAFPKLEKSGLATKVGNVYYLQLDGQK